MPPTPLGGSMPATPFGGSLRSPTPLSRAQFGGDFPAPFEAQDFAPPSRRSSLQVGSQMQPPLDGPARPVQNNPRDFGLQTLRGSRRPTPRSPDIGSSRPRSPDVSRRTSRSKDDDELLRTGTGLSTNRTMMSRMSAGPNRARKEQLHTALDALRASALVLARNQKLYCQILTSIAQDEQQDIGQLDSDDLQVVKRHRWKGAVWQNQLYSPRGEGADLAAQLIRLQASFEEKRQALKLRRQCERLQVVLKLISLEQQWERELAAVRELLPVSVAGAASSDDLNVRPWTPLGVVREDAKEAKDLVDICRIVDGNMVAKLRSQHWYAEIAAQLQARGLIAYPERKPVPQLRRSSPQHRLESGDGRGYALSRGWETARAPRGASPSPHGHRAGVERLLSVVDRREDTRSQ